MVAVGLASLMTWPALTRSNSPGPLASLMTWLILTRSNSPGPLASLMPWFCKTFVLTDVDRSRISLTVSILPTLFNLNWSPTSCQSQAKTDIVRPTNCQSHTKWNWSRPQPVNHTHWTSPAHKPVTQIQISTHTEMVLPTTSQSHRKMNTLTCLLYLT